MARSFCALFACLAVTAVMPVAVPSGPRQGLGLDCGPFVEVGRFQSREITECSGLAVSRRNPGILWVHNDSGDTARVFAVTERGVLRGIYLLGSAEAVDWEDVALGPCADPAKDCLYVGDIGDNRSRRAWIQVYRVEEPLVGPMEEVREVTLHRVERFDCRYPDGPHDAEALLVDPGSGIPYLVTKELASETRVYRFPSRPETGKTMVLEKVAALPSSPSITGGDVVRDGSAVILRDYLEAFVYLRPRGGSFQDLFRSVPRVMPLKGETQGEALGIMPSGKGIFTASEGVHAPIHKALCTWF